MASHNIVFDNIILTSYKNKSLNVFSKDLIAFLLFQVNKYMILKFIVHILKYRRKFIYDITNILTDTYRRALARCKPSLCPVLLFFEKGNQVVAFEKTP